MASAVLAKHCDCGRSGLECFCTLLDARVGMRCLLKACDLACKVIVHRKTGICYLQKAVHLAQQPSPSLSA